MTTTTTTLNRYAANIADDKPLAIFDIAPSDEIAQVDGTGEYINGFVSVPGIDWIEHIPGVNEPRFFPIESVCTSKNLVGYYVNRRGTQYVNFPSVRGIPLNYGGSPKARFSAIMDDIVSYEPVLILPSGGMCWGYPDRARSFEMLINMEPYSEAGSFNLFPDGIYQMDSFTYTGTVTEILDDKYPSPNTSVRSWTVVDGSEINFNDSVVLDGGTNYRMFLAVRTGLYDSSISINLNLENGTNYVFENIAPGTLSRIYGYNTDYDPDEFDATPEVVLPQWSVIPIDFRIDESFSSVNSNFSISVNGADANLASPILYSIDDKMPSTLVHEQPLVQFGGPIGTLVSVTADADFLHIYGYGQSDSFQVGEWARPMYLVFVDNDTDFEVYLDSERIMSISKLYSVPYYGPVHGEWIQISVSPSFKYIELSTVALYKEILGYDIQKLHRLFSYGPAHQDSINVAPNDGVYVANGASTKFASSVLFPRTAKFSDGIAQGVETQNSLMLPEFRTPLMINGSLLDTRFYSAMSLVGTEFEGVITPNEFFQLPENGEMHIRSRMVDSNVDYLVLGVVPLDAGTICSIYSNTMNYAANFQYSINPDNSSEINVYGWLTFEQGNATYDFYGSLYSSYESDPNYKESSYLEIAGVGMPFFTTTIDRRGFLLTLNFDMLRTHPNPNVSALFADDDLVFRVQDSSAYSHVGYASRAVMLGGDFFEVDEERTYVMAEPVDDNGLFPRRLLNNLVQTIYVSNGTIDTAAVGNWRVDIPLTNLSGFVKGVPDLDFIIYSDNRQSPQLVTSFNKDIMSYEELERFVHFGLGGEYEDLQTYSNPDKNYNQIGVSVNTSEPTLARFSNPAVETFVTLNSRVRWPNKDMGTHKIERAETKGFIDFESSPNSVLDTKWEIYDGFAIRIPKDINLYYYSLGFEVRMFTRSLNNRRPEFRRADFFGVASGDSPSNRISVGSGKSIVVGNDQDININKPFSTHLVTENVPTNMFTRELGFYPHTDISNNVISPIHFYLGQESKVLGVSFYINWRCETFQETGTENIAKMRYVAEGIVNPPFANMFTNVFKITGEPAFYNDYVPIDVTTVPGDPQLATLSAAGHNIYVDGQNDNMIEAMRWHMVYIEFDAPLSIDDRNLLFTLHNNKAVLNFITSHSTRVNPANLYSSRFGMTNQAVFEDDFTTELHYGGDPMITPLSGDSALLVYFERQESDPELTQSPDSVMEVSFGSNSVL